MPANRCNEFTPSSAEQDFKEILPAFRTRSNLGEIAIKRVHVLYSGRVQGVGFRFTAEAIARKLKVNGWASNLRDGRVEVVAEGEEAALKDFLSCIAEEMAHYIVDTGISWEQSTGEFKSFGIKFSE